MSQTTVELLALAYGVLTVVWGSVAASLLRLFVGRGLRPPAWQLLIAVTVGLSAFSALQGVLVLVPPGVRAAHPPWVTTAYLAGDVLITLIVTAWLHKVVVLTFGRRPGSRWLAVHWGACLAVVAWACVLAIECDMQGMAVTLYRIVLPLYVGATLAASLAQMAGGLRRGVWRPGALGALHPADVVAVGWVVLATIVFAGFQLDGGWHRHPLLLTVLLVSMNAAVAVPIVVRLLADVVRDVSLVLVLCGVGVLTLAGVDRVLAPLRGALAPDVASAAIVVAMVAVLLPTFLVARAALARLLPRGRPERQAALEQFLHGLSPELGVEECCRRALARLVQVLELRGAALRLADGTLLVEGAIRFEPLAAAWALLPEAVTPEASDVDEARRPRRPLLGWYEVQELPLELRAAIADTDVVGVIPIESPRCRWGDLFLSSGLLGATFAGDVIRVLEAYARQLGQVLDGAALLARTVGVERSLAHAEKLAAIGETTARIAHEIRNPLAAARSLAQQLAREPGMPFGEDLEVILGELERVERRMAGLLRLARREELRTEHVDLSALVETMGASVVDRLAAGGIRLRLDVVGGVHARVDRERLQQVLENLVHNAEDALDGRDGPRDLVIALGNGGGRAMLCVSDTGGGVPAAALARLFEPFYSTKPKGTGLGLAIVRGIVEAHGGRIRVLGAEGSGLTFEIELPLAGPEVA